MKTICTVALISALFCQPALYPIQPPKTPQTVISGHGWAYTVPFPVKNAQTIEKLIQCESQGVNITRPDSDGILSIEILQYHLGPLNTMQSSTWALLSKASGLKGSPAIPSDAIRMTDWAINHGLLDHSTYARLTGLL